MKKKRKISDNEFLSVLRENAGLFARTAKAIQTKYGIQYTRQAVRDRALKFPDELTDIEEETLDLAEGGLHSLMDSPDSRIKLKAIEIFLKNKGQKRGYGDAEYLKEKAEKELGLREKRIKAMTEEELDNELKKYGFGKLDQ